MNESEFFTSGAAFYFVIQRVDFFLITFEDHLIGPVPAKLAKQKPYKVGLVINWIIGL